MRTFVSDNSDECQARFQAGLIHVKDLELAAAGLAAPIGAGPLGLQGQPGLGGVSNFRQPAVDLLFSGGRVKLHHH